MKSKLKRWHIASIIAFAGACVALGIIFALSTAMEGSVLRVTIRTYRAVEPRVVSALESMFAGFEKEHPGYSVAFDLAEKPGVSYDAIFCDYARAGQNLAGGSAGAAKDAPGLPDSLAKMLDDDGNANFLPVLWEPFGVVATLARPLPGADPLSDGRPLLVAGKEPGRAYDALVAWVAWYGSDGEIDAVLGGKVGNTQAALWRASMVERAARSGWVANPETWTDGDAYVRVLEGSACALAPSASFVYGDPTVLRWWSASPRRGSAPAVGRLYGFSLSSGKGCVEAWNSYCSAKSAQEKLVSDIGAPFLLYPVNESASFADASGSNAKLLLETCTRFVALPSGKYDERRIGRIDAACMPFFTSTSASADTELFSTLAGAFAE